MTLQRKSPSVRTCGRRSRAQMFLSCNDFQGTSTEPVTYVEGGGGRGGTPTITPWKTSGALRHLPAITQNRCCDLTGQQARGPCFMANISGFARPSGSRTPGRASVWGSAVETSAGREDKNTSDLQIEVTQTAKEQQSARFLSIHDPST